MAVATKDKLVTLEALKAVNDLIVVKKDLSNVDQDDIVTPGMYYLNYSTCTTSGETNWSGNLIVSSNSTGNRVFQIRLGASGTQPMWRSRAGSTPTWSTWENIIIERRATYDMSVNVSSATIGTRCANQNFVLPTGVTRDNIKAIYISKNTAGAAANVVPTISGDGKLYINVYAASNNVNAEITVTLVY